MKTVREKIAVITGGGSGIGRSVAIALADAGAHVVVADIQEKTVMDVAEELRERGVRSLGVACDVSRFESVTGLADRAYAEFGRVDILCNNAGVSMRPFRGILDTTVDDWRFMMGINVWGVVHGLLAFLPRMRLQDGEKHIVNTASISAFLPMEGHSVYSATKGAVMALTDAITGELAPLGFGVTNFCPSAVATNLGANVDKIWGKDADAASRTFEPVDTPMMSRVSGRAGKPTVETVGVMVRNAILDNAPYLNTQAIEGDLLSDRMHRMFGGQTIGREK